AADVVVEEIKKLGGKAVANYDSVEFGQKIVDTAIKAFGGVHILINNAGILRDKSILKMTDQDFDLVYKVHLFGTYSVTKAAWPHFNKQKYGRIINTSSAVGLYGNFGQINYSAAKGGIIGFSNTCALEGENKNILSNVVAPNAGTRMTKGVFPDELHEMFKPDYIAPLVGLLASEECPSNGAVYESGSCKISKVRWQRSQGATLSTIPDFNPMMLLHGEQYVEIFKPLQAEATLSAKGSVVEVLDKGKSAVVVVGGTGLGKIYALLLAERGAKVVINDLGDAVVEEIKKFGGKAVANHDSVEFGQKVVDTAIKAFGGVHILVNNAGILRDKSIVKMTDQDFDLVYKVHLFGTYSVTKAAWSHFSKQKYGRIINTSSAVGLYGNFGQINYSAAKGGIIGFTNTIALEGESKNILSNVVAPNAGTAMTKGVFPDELHEMFKPDYIAPLVGLLASEECPSNGAIFESGSCKISKVRWQRSQGVALPPNNITADHIKENWGAITNFENDVSNPSSISESFQHFYEQYSLQAEKLKSQGESKSTSGSGHPNEFPYTKKDTILYNIGLGATRNELNYVYENDDSLLPLPTFPVIHALGAATEVDFSEAIPEFNPMMLLHGEQYVEIFKPLPAEGTLSAKGNIIEVLDKGKSAVVVVGGTGVDINTGEKMYYSEFTAVIRGSGGFGGKTKGTDRGPATAANIAPSRKPDVVASYKTSEDLAILYRLNGDYNPLHIDPQMSAVGGFDVPILHGLCTFGISVKQIVDKLGKSNPASVHRMKTRFAKHVFPGETLEVRMWKDDSNPKKVIFQTYVKERDAIVLNNSAVEFFEEVHFPPKSHL
ncbi:peroxisomal hydratase-dehydrogenase-epimerase-like protein, partial [Conidiobolus coronatus NRRL 28638]